MYLFDKIGNIVAGWTGTTVNSEIFAKSIKRHICDVQTSQLRHDLPLSVNDRVILLFREGLIFTKLRICEVSRNKTLAKTSELQYLFALFSMFLLITMMHQFSLDH